MNLPELLHRPAHRLYPFRQLLLMLAALAFASGLYFAVNSEDLHAWPMRLALIGAIWSLLLYVCIQLFHELPPPSLPALRWRDRWRDRLRRGFYQVMAAVLLLLMLVLLQMSLKLLTV